MARRRLVTAAVAGVLALVALTGCRSEPGSAAFVADTRITTDEVNAVLDGVQADGGKVKETNKGGARSQITSLLVFVQVAKQYAREKNYTDPQVNYQAAAEQIGLPASDLYVRLVADATAYRALLLAQATPAAVTDADYLAAADLAIQQGIQGDRATVAATIKASLSDQIARGVAVRDGLTDVIKRDRVSVNPLYAPAAVALVTSQQITLMVLPLTAGGTTAPAVTNVTQF